MNIFDCFVSLCLWRESIVFYFLQPFNPYTNPYLAPHLADYRLRSHLNLPPTKAVTAAAAALHADKHHVKGHHLTDYYVYDVAKIPECAYTNKHYYNLTFCLQDDYYPTYVAISIPKN